jgi:hypothetical protein
MNALAGNEEEMKKASATALGFLAATVVPAAYFALMFPLSGVQNMRSIAGTFLVACFVASVATATLGIPMFLLLARFKLIRWWSAASSGMLAGIIVIYAIRFSSQVELTTIFLFSMLGGAAGFVFWRVWSLGRV